MSVLTVGETMVLFDPLVDGRPRAGMTLTLRVAGAESNFAGFHNQLHAIGDFTGLIDRDDD